MVKQRCCEEPAPPSRSSRLLFLTAGADSKKIKAVIQNFETCFLFQFRGHICQPAEFGVNDFLALDANGMRMRIGFMAVIAIAPLGEPQFQDPIEFFEERDCFVYGSKACSGKIRFDLRIDSFRAWVFKAGNQNL